MSNTKNIRAIIPVAGAGKNLRPLTYTQPKCLIPVAGKPIIDYIIDQLVDVGVKKYTIVIGYMGDKIEQYVSHKYPTLDIQYVVQNVRLGLGHAIYTAKDTVQLDEELIIVLGDTIVELDMKHFLKEAENVVGIQRVEDPREFGVAEVDPEGKVTVVIEKPRIPRSNLALVGVYKIGHTEALFDALAHLIKQSEEGHEIELTEALMNMVKNDIVLKAVRVATWFDCGRKDILLDTNATLLNEMQGVSEDLLKDNIIIPPVFFGENVSCHHSIIGPFVSIGRNTTIESAIVKNSIIGEYSHIKELILEDSIVGTDASISGSGHRLNLGDNTEINLA